MIGSFILYLYIGSINKKVARGYRAVIELIHYYWARAKLSSLQRGIEEVLWDIG